MIKLKTAIAGGLLYHYYTLIVNCFCDSLLYHHKTSVHWVQIISDLFQFSPTRLRIVEPNKRQ